MTSEKSNKLLEVADDQTSKGKYLSSQTCPNKLTCLKQHNSVLSKALSHHVLAVLAILAALGVRLWVATPTLLLKSLRHSLSHRSLPSHSWYLSPSERAP